MKLFNVCANKLSLSLSQGSIGPSKGSINSQGVEWRSMNGQGVNEKLLGSIGDMKPPIQIIVDWARNANGLFQQIKQN